MNDRDVLARRGVIAYPFTLNTFLAYLLMCLALC
jgi:hypothetical protein